MSREGGNPERRCRTEGCKRPYRAKSYCNVHYRQWRRGKLGKARYKICSTEECAKKRFQGGLCETHYQEWRAAKAKPAPAEDAPEAV